LKNTQIIGQLDGKRNLSIQNMLSQLQSEGVELKKAKSLLLQLKESD
jgi:hypothetical protein